MLIHTAVPSTVVAPSRVAHAGWAVPVVPAFWSFWMLPLGSINASDVLYQVSAVQAG